MPLPRAGTESFFGLPTLPGWFIDMDPPQHTTFRKLLAEHFTIQQVEAQRSLIEQIVRECLADLRQTGPGADLIRHFALPVALRVIGSLMGVPRQDLPTLEKLTNALFSLQSSAAQGAEALDKLTDFCRDLVRDSRTQGEGGNVLSTLGAEREFNDESLAGAAVLLLTAGHETTASMLGLSALLLLTTDGDIAGLLAPDRAGDTVEELLRYLSIFHLGVVRGAIEDVQLAGQTIKAGDHVTIALPAANHDPERFTDPKRFEPDRDTRGHIAFGYGIHQCIGRNLSRLELQVGLCRLFGEFPGLELAIDPQEVKFFHRGTVYGVSALPVSWSHK